MRALLLIATSGTVRLLGPDGLEASLGAFATGGGVLMRLLDRFSRAGAVRLTGVLVAAVAVAACCVGVSSAAAEEGIRTIPVGSHPVCRVFGWNPRLGRERRRSSTVSEIEASSGTVIRTIPVGSDPDGVSSDGTHVWVTNSVEDTVSEIEASSGTVIRTIPVGSAPMACPRMEPTSGSRTPSRRTRSVRSKRRAAPSSARSPSAATPMACPRMEPTSGSRTTAEDTVSEIEASSGTVIRTIPVGSGPHGVSSDGTHVWVANEGRRYGQ